MIKEINDASEAVGITTFITNSNERIENQLNRITGIEKLPIMLVSWDIDTDLSFDINGFLQNPSSKVVCLLMDKAESNTEKSRQDTAVKMGQLFTLFVRQLNDDLRRFNLLGENSISSAGYKLVPIHGAGKHSGVLGRFTMATEIINCVEEDC